MNNFLVPLNWFYTKYYGKDPLRFWTEQVALNLFVQRGGKTIIETGTIREPDDWGGGNSTMIFGDFAKRMGATLITVDNESKKIEFSREYTKEYASNIEYVLSDSVEFLKNYSGQIDLLYLDSLDFPLYPEKEDYEEEIRKSQLHNLNEVKAAEDKLTSKSIILIDDNDFPAGGKAGLTNLYLESAGWECLIASRQILFIQGKYENEKR